MNMLSAGAIKFTFAVLTKLVWIESPFNLRNYVAALKIRAEKWDSIQYFNRISRRKNFIFPQFFILCPIIHAKVLNNKLLFSHNQSKSLIWNSKYEKLILYLYRENLCAMLIKLYYFTMHIFFRAIVNPFKIKN